MEKQKVITCVTSSSIPTLAHYLIIIKKLKNLQKNKEVFFLIGDLHALSTRKEESEIPSFQKESANIIFSCGIENVYIQSQLMEHTFLSYILGSFIKVSELEKLHQYREKIENNSFQSLALLSYPSLMISDIFLFDADVLVGPDQKQHLELAIKIFQRLDKKFKGLFRKPKKINFKEFKIKDLQFPEKKMSKTSKNNLGTIYLNDSLETIKKKIIKCKTDSENIIKYEKEKKFGVSNLILIYSLCKDIEILEAEQELNKKCNNYLDLKIEVFNSIKKELEPIQKKMKEFKKNPKLIQIKLEKSLKKAKKIVENKINQISKVIKIPFLNDQFD